MQTFMRGCVRRCACTVNPFAFLQIASMGLQTTLLIVLAGTCATAGNDIRLHKSLMFFDSPLAVDYQRTRCANDWA